MGIMTNSNYIEFDTIKNFQPTRRLRIISEQEYDKNSYPCVERIYDCEYGVIHVVESGGGGWNEVKARTHHKAVNKYLELAKEAGELYEA